MFDVDDKKPDPLLGQIVNAWVGNETINATLDLSYLLKNS
jgi:hypothetical protein